MPKFEPGKLPEAQYTPFSTAAPAPADLGAALKGIARAGFAALEKNEIDKLRGEEGDQIPGLEGIGEGRIAPGSEYDPKASMNLNQIKLAREQGLLSPTQARLLVGKRIKEQAGVFPGMEDELRASAQSFFGEFGPGDMLLDTTGQAKQTAFYEKNFLGPGVAAGYINPVDPYNDLEGQQAWHRYIQTRTKTEGDMRFLELRAKRGDAVGLDLGNAYIDSYVDDSVNQVLLGLGNATKNGQRIGDTNEIRASLVQSKQVHHQMLDSKLQGVKLADSQRKTLHDRIDEKYKGLEEAIDSGSLEKFIQDKYTLFEQSAKMWGAQNMGMQLAMEVNFPGTMKTLIELTPALNRAHAQGKEFIINGLPTQLQSVLRNVLTDPQASMNFYNDLMSGKMVVTGNEHLDRFNKALAQEATKAAPADELPGKSGKNAKQAMIQNLATYDPSMQTIDTYNNESVMWTVRNDPKELAKFQNFWMGHYNTTITDIQNTITDGASGERLFNITRQNGKWTISTTPAYDAKVEAGDRGVVRRVSELNDMLDDLDKLDKSVQMYNLDLTNEMPPDEWVDLTENLINTNAPLPGKAEVRMGVPTQYEVGAVYQVTDSKGNKGRARWTEGGWEPIE